MDEEMVACSLAGERSLSWCLFHFNFSHGLSRDLTACPVDLISRCDANSKHQYDIRKLDSRMAMEAWPVQNFDSRC